MFISTLICFSLCLSLVRAASLGYLFTRDVFNPTILSPNASTVWPIGTQQYVVWETDNIPPPDKITNAQGMVVLGHLGPTGGLNLNLSNPLASGFSYTIGQVQITVPDVPPRQDYIVVLFGDSGNASPAFAITQIAPNDGGNQTTTMTTSTAGSTSSPNAPTPGTPTPSPSDSNVAPTTTAEDSSPTSLSALSASVSTALQQFTATGVPSVPTPSATKINSALTRYPSVWMLTLSALGVLSLITTPLI